MNLKLFVACSMIVISTSLSARVYPRTGAATIATGRGSVRSGGTETTTTSGGKFGASRTATNSQATGHQATTTTSQGGTVSSNNGTHTATNGADTKSATVNNRQIAKLKKRPSSARALYSAQVNATVKNNTTTAQEQKTATGQEIETTSTNQNAEDSTTNHTSQVASTQELEGPRLMQLQLIASAPAVTTTVSPTSPVAMEAQIEKAQAQTQLASSLMVSSSAASMTNTINTVQANFSEINSGQATDTRTTYTRTT